MASSVLEDTYCLLINLSIGYCKVLLRLSEDSEVMFKTFVGFSPSTSKFKDKECLWEWRPLECDTDHEPETASNMSSVCINKDLYYASQPHVPGSSIAMAMISFNLKTEAFVSYQIPETLMSRHSPCETCPFNIRGKVGISFANKAQRIHRIWVLEDVKDNKWSLLLLNAPLPIQDVNMWMSQRPPSFQGLTKNDDLVYAKAQLKDLVICYYIEEQSQEIIVEGVLKDRSMIFFWGYVP